MRFVILEGPHTGYDNYYLAGNSAWLSCQTKNYRLQVSKNHHHPSSPDSIPTSGLANGPNDVQMNGPNEV